MDDLVERAGQVLLDAGLDGHQCDISVTVDTGSPSTAKLIREGLAHELILRIIALGFLCCPDRRISLCVHDAETEWDDLDFDSFEREYGAGLLALAGNGPEYLSLIDTMSCLRKRAKKRRSGRPTFAIIITPTFTGYTSHWVKVLRKASKEPIHLQVLHVGLDQPPRYEFMTLRQAPQVEGLAVPNVATISLVDHDDHGALLEEMIGHYGGWLGNAIQRGIVKT